LFESEKFALDPTDPRFRETKAADFIAEERARRRSAKKSLERKNRRIDRRSDEDENGENAKTAKSATEKKSQIARGGRRRVARDGFRAEAEIGGGGARARRKRIEAEVDTQRGRDVMRDETGFDSKKKRSLIRR
jgi:hypothetical protein